MQRLFATLLGVSALLCAQGAATTTIVQVGCSTGPPPQVVPPQQNCNPSYLATFSWTGDPSTGAVPLTALTAGGSSTAQQFLNALQGLRVISVETKPGSPAPTNGYSVQILDPSGADVLSGAAASVSSSTSQGWTPSTFSPPINGTISLNLTGQSVASAKGTVYVFFAPVTTTLSGGSSGGGSSGLVVGTTTIANGTNGDCLFDNAGILGNQACGSGGMVYPGAGIANSTGSAWGTSYTTSGSGTVVALVNSPVFITPALGTPASGNASNLTNLPITLTTTGSSGASTWTQSTNTLNIPQYTGGSGNPANTVNVSFSATPTFTCGSSSAGTVTFFIVGSLTGNITSSTVASCTVGQIVVIKFVQDATGGRTWVPPTGWNGVCQPSPIASTVTMIAMTITSTGADPLGASCGTESGPAIGTEIAAPTGLPASSTLWSWPDSTSATQRWKNPAGTFFSPEVDLSTGNVRCAGGTNSPDTSCSPSQLSTAGAALKIASGTAALGTSAITSGACATTVTVSATGVATTDVITVAPNSRLAAITGYLPSTAGGLNITWYPTLNNVNFDVCNNTSGSITPGAVTLNFYVMR